MTKKSRLYLWWALVFVVGVVVLFHVFWQSKQEVLADKIAAKNEEITLLRNEREKEYAKDTAKVNPIIEKANKLIKERDDKRAEYDKQITELKKIKADLEAQLERPLD